MATKNAAVERLRMENNALKNALERMEKENTTVSKRAELMSKALDNVKSSRSDIIDRLISSRMMIARMGGYIDAIRELPVFPADAEPIETIHGLDRLSVERLLSMDDEEFNSMMEAVSTKQP